MSLLDGIIGRLVQIAGVDSPPRRAINFVSGVTAADNPANNSTDIAIAGSSPQTSTPANVAASGLVGTSGLFARGDHIHGHGALAGGSLHAVATTSVAGFMSAADKVAVASIGTGFTSSGTITCNALVSSSVSTGALSCSSITDAGLGAGVVHSSSGGVFSSSLVVDADVSSSAAIAGSKLQAASGSNAGAQSAAQFTLVASATSSATNSALCVRDASGNCSFAGVTATSITGPLLQSAAPPTGTGATAGTALVVEAQDGQNVASGTNNSGANLTLAASKAGTGGTGGSPGFVSIGIGQSNFTELFRIAQNGTGVSLGMLTQAAAAGGNTSLYAQRGATGQRGGQLFLGGGEDGTAGAGTDGGNGGIFLDTGSPGSSTAAKIMMGFSGTTSFMDFYVDTSSNSNINTGSRNFRILTTGSFICNPSGTATFVASGQAFLAGSQTTLGGSQVNFTDASTSTVYSTLVQGTTCTFAPTATVTGGWIFGGGPSAASTNGASTFVKGQTGGTVASGTNTNGGACRIVMGAIGSGGTGGTGAAGVLNLEHPTFGNLVQCRETSNGFRLVGFCGGATNAANNSAGVDGGLWIGDAATPINKQGIALANAQSGNAGCLISHGGTGGAGNGGGPGQLVAADKNAVIALTPTNATTVAAPGSPWTQVLIDQDVTKSGFAHTSTSAVVVYTRPLTDLVKGSSTTRGIIRMVFIIQWLDSAGKVGTINVTAAVAVTGSGVLSTQFSTSFGAISAGTSTDGSSAGTITPTHAIDASGNYSLSLTASAKAGGLGTGFIRTEYAVTVL